MILFYPLLEFLFIFVYAYCLNWHLSWPYIRFSQFLFRNLPWSSMTWNFFKDVRNIPSFNIFQRNTRNLLLLYSVVSCLSERTQSKAKNHNSKAELNVTKELSAERKCDKKVWKINEMKKKSGERDCFLVFSILCESDFSAFFSTFHLFSHSTHSNW